MDRNRISKVLKKISSLLEDDDLNTLERDLAKRYLLELYEFVDQTSSKKPEPVAPAIEPQGITPAPRDESRSAEVPRMEPQQEPSARETFSLPEQERFEIEAAVSQNRTERSSPVPLESKDKMESQDRPQVSPLPFQKEVADVVTREETLPTRYRVLFERSDQNELSDKLSLSPINDLRRALGINDKLLVVNELFAGDHEHFQETIDRLNTKYSFLEARSYLVRYVIDKFEWLDEQKQAHARDFIKLVERRFLNSSH